MAEIKYERTINEDPMILPTLQEIETFAQLEHFLKDICPKTSMSYSEAISNVRDLIGKSLVGKEATVTIFLPYEVVAELDEEDVTLILDAEAK